MADPTFNLFGPISKDDIKVGYISTDRGYLKGVSVCDANEYAQENPGTTFIYKPDRKTVEFLNINQVNDLARNPGQSSTDESCPDGLNMNSIPDPPKVVFMGGGGVGAVANPVIGDDGAVLAVHMVNGGFGYKYPPIVEVRDDSGIGAGAVVKVDVGNVDNEMIYYADKEDFEQYEICDSGIPEDEYGRRWGPDGKDIGKWSPQAYVDGKVPFAEVLDEYIKKVQEAGKDWFTTRKKPPLKVTSTGQSNTTFFKVNHPAWGNFMNEYAISPKPPSNVKPSDFSGQWFTFEWNLDFPYDGDYTFRTARDNKSRIYIDNVSYTDRLQTNTGTNPASGKVGTTTGHGNKITMKKGSKVLRLDLYNEPEFEMITVQQPPPPSTQDIVFKITSGSMFANGVRIEGLDINEVKPFTPPNMGKKGQINVSHTRKIDYGKKYKVVFTSKGKGGVQGDIKYTGLKEGGLRRASATRLEFDDNPSNGFDVNASFTVDRGKAKFSADGKRLEGSGSITLTLSWNDNPRTSGRALNKIQIGGKTWTVTRSTTGSETHTIELSGGQPNIKLRTMGSNIIQMEDFTDNDWTDIIVNASGGQFTDLKGSVAYFSVPHPPDKTGKSKSSKGIQTREVFNTVDYINKANRQLWRTNVYSKGGFLNDNGICPFDTSLQLKDNPYAGDHKIVWPNVNFPIDGNYTIEVAVDDNVDLSIGNQVNLTKKGFIGDSSVSTGTLKTSRFIKGGNHNITAKLNQIAGGAFSFKAQDGKTTKTKIKVNANVQGSYGNRITIPGLFSLSKDYKGSAVSMNREIELEVGKEYDVIINTTRSRGEAASSDVRKGAIRFRTTQDGSGGLGQSGPRLEYEDRLGSRAGKRDHRDITVSVSQGRFYGVSGNRCKFMVGESMKGINPMALAINIETEFSEKEIKSKRSWNENPMGVALTIESPRPPIPQQPVPKAEGRCPNNPFWTTRFPGAKEFWHPVKYQGWSPFFNEHAMSPLPPDDEGDARNDTGSFTNIWTKEFAFGGWYKIIMEVDDIGEFWIDDTKHIDLSRRRGKIREEKLIYIDGPTSSKEDPVSHDIKVVVENYKSQRTRTFDAKVFSTLDWISGGTAKADKKTINFKITSGSMFANSIRIPELDIHESKKFTPVHDDQGRHMGRRGQINATLQREVEVNKVYKVELLSSNSITGIKLRTKGENLLQMEDHTDSDWTDIQCAATEGRFFDFKPGANKATCKYVVTSATRVSGGVSGSTTREGVVYEGPHLFHYEDSRWGKVMNQTSVSPISSATQSLSDPNDNIGGTKILTWKNVKFPQTAKYDISLVGDNWATLFIDGKKVDSVKNNFKQNEHIIKSIDGVEGTHDITVELVNGTASNVFLKDPTGVALRITTKMTVGTGKYKPWTENPIGVSAKLIPPPCPKPNNGKGKLKDPEVYPHGDGYPKPPGGGYPVILKLKKVKPKPPGINYDCKKDKIRLEPSMGSELKLKCGPFGGISEIDIIKPGLGFTRVPNVIVETETGINLDVELVFEPEIAPFDIPDIVQVTDLVGLKQTGYYKGKPYYGAVFYENGVKYSGWYKTAGEMVQVYDTMQGSIDAIVTTPPSAILRQGSDVSSNDPRLNIPGTPENLT